MRHLCYNLFINDDLCFGCIFCLRASYDEDKAPVLHGLAQLGSSACFFAAAGTIINGPMNRMYVLTADHCFIDKTQINNFRYWRARLPQIEYLQDTRFLGLSIINPTSQAPRQFSTLLLEQPPLRGAHCCPHTGSA